MTATREEDKRNREGNAKRYATRNNLPCNSYRVKNENAYVMQFEFLTADRDSESERRKRRIFADLSRVKYVIKSSVNSVIQ